MYLIEIIRHKHLMQFQVRLFRDPPKEITDDTEGIQLTAFGYGPFHSEEQAFKFATEYAKDLANVLGPSAIIAI